MAGVKGRSGGARKGTGPKPFQPTADQRTIVGLAKAFGFTLEQMAQLIINPRTKAAISVTVLSNHFQAELSQGYPRAIFNVANALYQSATRSKNVTAQIAFLKMVAKWSENVNVTVRRPEEMSDEELDAALAARLGNDPLGEGGAASAIGIPRATTGESSTRH